MLGNGKTNYLYAQINHEAELNHEARVSGGSRNVSEGCPMVCKLAGWHGGHLF